MCGVSVGVCVGMCVGVCVGVCFGQKEGGGGLKRLSPENNEKQKKCRSVNGVYSSMEVHHTPFS